MELKFFPEFKESLLNETKTSTLRKDSKGLVPGDLIDLMTSRDEFISLAVVIKIQKITICDFEWSLAISEGYSCTKELTRAIEELYPDREEFTRIVFKVLD